MWIHEELYAPLPFLLKSQNNGPLYSNTGWLVHWPLIGGLLHLVQRGGDWAGWGPAERPIPLLAVPNVTAHPSVYQLHIIWCGTTILPLDSKGLSSARKAGLYATALSFCLSVCLSVRSFACRLWNLWSHSLRVSTWRRVAAYHIDYDTLVENKNNDSNSTSGNSESRPCPAPQCTMLPRGKFNRIIPSFQCTPLSCNRFRVLLPW